MIHKLLYLYTNYIYDFLWQPPFNTSAQKKTTTAISRFSKNVPFVFLGKSKSNRFGKTWAWVNDAKPAFNLIRGTFPSQMVAYVSISF